MACVIVPLIKNKGSDLTDIHNYRAIVLSNVETKLLESVILQRVVKYTESVKYQFGFKSGHSTSLCASVMKQTISYYVNRGIAMLLYASWTSLKPLTKLIIGNCLISS